MHTYPIHTVWLDPGFGASGDMLLGAFVDLGVGVDAVAQMVGVLGIDGLSLRAEDVQRCSLRSAKVHVEVPDTSKHRKWSTIDEMIRASSLPASVSEGARRTFRRLGEVEAKQHGVPLDDVHFHEVGALDAIVDIVGVWSAWHLLGEPAVRSGPAGLGHGTVEAAHGTLPLPAPATVALLETFPVKGLDVQAETVTPTGAALLVTLSGGSTGPLPQGMVIRSGRGAGGRDPSSYPNVVSAVLLETDPGAPELSDTELLGVGDRAIELTTNVDDVTPESLGYLIERLLEAGADDAWITPIVMKKSRPAHAVTALAHPSVAEELRVLILTETGSLGLRQRVVDKFVLPRRIDVISMRGHDIRVKVGPFGAKPEHDDLAIVARAHGLALRQVRAEAVAAWSARATAGATS